MDLFSRIFSNRNIHRLIVFVILLGTALRIIFYLQDRCLFIDEANVARNIYERSFIALTQPLNYEQYAPPLFLWVIKCTTLFFGFSEMALRLFPLLCSIASLWLAYKAMKKYAGANGIWYALAIMATGVIYVTYAGELKQYSCDAMVTLCLLLLSLRMDIFSIPKARFTGIWFVAGSVAIWLSMPSVFMLTGIGAYYMYQCVRSRRYGVTVLPVTIGILWVVQFALYYLVILKPQIQSDYLQNCHKDFFLYALPNTAQKINYDATTLNKLISATGGKWALSVVFNLLCLITGVVALFRKEAAKAILITIPVCALLAAAMVKQYALTPRLVLFIMPLLLMLIASGLTRLFHIKYLPLKAIWAIAGLICIINYSTFSLFYKRMEMEEITKSMAYVQQQHIDAAHLYVHNTAVPAYIYYTTIHPEKDKWKDIAHASQLHWNSNYDSLAQTFSGRSALLYSWAPDDEIAAETARISKYHKEIAEQVVTGSRVYIYQ